MIVPERISATFKTAVTAAALWAVCSPTLSQGVENVDMYSVSQSARVDEFQETTGLGTASNAVEFRFDLPTIFDEPYSNDQYLNGLSQSAFVTKIVSFDQYLERNQELSFEFNGMKGELGKSVVEILDDGTFRKLSDDNYYIIGADDIELINTILRDKIPPYQLSGSVDVFGFAVDEDEYRIAIGNFPIRLREELGRATVSIVNTRGSIGYERLSQAEAKFTSLGIAGAPPQSMPHCDETHVYQPALGTCSGVFVNHEDWGSGIVTAAHCVIKDNLEGAELLAVFDFEAENIEFNIQDKQRDFISTSFAILNTDPKYLRYDEFEPVSDIVFIPIVEMISDIPVRPVELDFPKSTDIGAYFFFSGHPSHRPKSAAVGPENIVTGIREDVIFVALDNFKGSSGGPIFDFSGDLLGVVSYQFASDIFNFDYAFDESMCYREAVISTEKAFPLEAVSVAALMQ